jgi:hypothetical protein
MLKLDGNGDCVNIGAHEVFNPGADPFSISAWVRQEAWQNNWGDVMIGKRGEGGVGWQLRRFGGDQNWSWTTRGMGNDDYPRSNLSPPLNVWHHVVAVRDGTQKLLYINGKLDSTQGINSNPVNACTHHTYIGARANGDNSGTESHFKGQLDEVRLYKHALTHGQVLTLMNYVATNEFEDTWKEMGDADISLGRGSQWMDMAYDNSQWYYQASARRLAPFADWTKGGAKALVIWFRGNPGNAGELAVMSVTLRDHPLTPDGRHAATVPYDGDREDLNSGEWQEWNIDLAEFGDVNLPGMGDIAIGVRGLGDDENPGGLLGFDNIRLYPTRCVPMYGPLADLTGDCLVDAMDLRELVADWLVTDTTATPNPAGLVAHYQFEGNYDDSSGNGNHGTPYGAVGFETDPDMGQVLDLPGGSNQYVEVGAVGISGNDATTIACWAKADHTSIPDWTLVFGFTTTGGGDGSHFNIGSLGGPGGVGAHIWGWENTIFTDTEALEWRHYAMTWDGTILAYYGDGLLVDAFDPVAAGETDLSIRADNVHMGSRITQDSSFPGNVEDAYIYDYALSGDEIRGLMAVKGAYAGMPDSDIYSPEPIGSKSVNLKDYAAMMEEWLTEVYWP